MNYDFRGSSSLSRRHLSVIETIAVSLESIASGNAEMQSILGVSLSALGIISGY